MHIIVTLPTAAIPITIITAIVLTIVTLAVMATDHVSGADGTCADSSTLGPWHIIGLLSGYTMGGAVVLGLELWLFGLIMLGSSWVVHDLAAGLSTKVIMEVASQQ